MIVVFIHASLENHVTGVVTASPRRVVRLWVPHRACVRHTANKRMSVVTASAAETNGLERGVSHVWGGGAVWLKEQAKARPLCHLDSIRSPPLSCCAGGISIGFNLGTTSFMFVCCHLKDSASVCARRLCSLLLLLLSNMQHSPLLPFRGSGCTCDLTLQCTMTLTSPCKTPSCTTSNWTTLTQSSASETNAPHACGTIRACRRLSTTCFASARSTMMSMPHRRNHTATLSVVHTGCVLPPSPPSRVSPCWDHATCLTQLAPLVYIVVWCYVLDNIIRDFSEKTASANPFDCEPCLP